MAKQDLVFAPDFTGVMRGLRAFHRKNKYPMELKLANGEVKHFDNYRQYHNFINKACQYYRKTGNKHPLLD